MRAALAGVAVVLAAASGGAHAEPCAMMGLSSRALRPDFAVSAEGGIVVGEQPSPEDYRKPLSPDRSAWKARVKGKSAAAKEDAIAPGLVVYRPPAGAQSYDLVDGAGKRQASAKLAAKLPDLLDAPRVRAVTSGETHSMHVSTFVSVSLDAAAPKDAIALVLQKSKGPALSWGVPFEGATEVSVYSTQGGCVDKFPAGTTIAQPGELVVAFWVDATGRRSRVSPVVVVDKAP